MAQRIIITVRGGMLESIHSDGLDISGATVLVLDGDTEGADDSDLCTVDGKEYALTVTSVVPASDDLSRDARRIYDTWAMT